MVSGYAEKFKMAEPSDYSSSSEDDEYSDPLEVAASAGARLSRKSQYQVCFVRIQSRGYLNRKPIQRIRFL